MNILFNSKKSLAKLKLKNPILRNIDLLIEQILHSQQENTFHTKKTPWHLLISPTIANKEELIESSVSIENTLEQKGHEYKAWICENNVIINIPDSMLAKTKNINTWKNIISLFSSHRKHNPVDGIILVFNLQHLITRSKQNNFLFIKKLHDILTAISKKLPHTIPLYIVFSHLNATQGYYEFFASLNKKEIDNPLGFNFPITSEPQSLKNHFVSNYQKLLTRFQKHLLYKMQANPNLDGLPLAYEFPIQFEKNKEYILSALESLFSTNILKKIKLRGMFFTAHPQRLKPIDALSQYTKDVITTNPLSLPSARKKMTAFSKDLFSSVIPQDNTLSIIRDKQIERKNKRKKQLTVTFGLVFTIILSSYFIKAFYDDNKTISNINQNLFQAQIHLNKLSVDHDKSEHLVKLLRELHDAKQQFDNLTLFNWLSIIPSNIKKTKTNIGTFYNNTINNIVIPTIPEQIHQQLQKALTSNNPLRIYDYLNAYIMLANNNYYSPEALYKATINSYKDNPYYSNKDINDLIPHIKAALKTPPKTSIDNKLIAKAKEKLVHSLPQLAFALFLQNIKSEPISIINKTSLTPDYYLKDNFLENYNHAIPIICQDLYDSHLLFDLNVTQIPHSKILETTQITRDLYLNSYTKWWQHYLYLLMPNSKATTTNEIRETLLSLTKNKMLIEQAVDDIIYNTTKFKQLDQGAIIFNNQIARYFYAINKNIKTTEPQFRKVLSYLLINNPHVLQDKKWLKTNFIKTREIFKHNELTKTISELKNKDDLLSKWLFSFASNVSSLYFKLAAIYIDQTWEIILYDNHINNLADKYPFNKKVSEEISLSEFKSLFSPDSILSNFFNKYIDPFFNTSSSSWELKSVNGNTLPFDISAKEFFIRFKLIQKMFFQNNKFGFSFALSPIKIHPHLESVSISINEQELVMDQDKKVLRSFNWPNNYLNLVSVSVEDINGARSTTLENSQWALFKLLDKGKLKQINANDFELILNLTGHPSAFKLTAHSKINPFIKNVITQYKTPKSLFTDNNNA